MCYRSSWMPPSTYRLLDFSSGHGSQAFISYIEIQNFPASCSTHRRIETSYSHCPPKLKPSSRPSDHISAHPSDHPSDHFSSRITCTSGTHTPGTRTSGAHTSGTPALHPSDLNPHPFLLIFPISAHPLPIDSSHSTIRLSCP